MSPTNQPDPGETLVAFGRQLERLTRRQDELDGLLTQLATDVQTLVTRADTDKDTAPRSWLLAEDEEQAVADLVELTGWLGRVYLRYPGAALPSCWCFHPAVVEELWWLRQAHREAYAPGARSTQKAGDWHDRSRPGVVARLASVARDCDLSRHIEGGDRIQDPPLVPLAGEAAWVATHWVNDGTPLPTDAQLEAARFADQRWTLRR
ncbi:MAG TPA: hypothetical protein VGL88_11780 [Pseudonocardiaceae bacterium]|jgi:hypothetical protein